MGIFMALSHPYTAKDVLNNSWIMFTCSMECQILLCLTEMLRSLVDSGRNFSRFKVVN